MGNNNGRFSDGLIFGAILGGAAVFLLGTEKGNKVLKLMIEEGRVGFSELMDEIEDYKKQAREVVEVMQDDINEEEVDDMEKAVEGDKSEEKSHEEKAKSSTKRFFKKK